MTVNRETVKNKLIARKKELEVAIQSLAENRASIEAEEVQDPVDQAIKSEIDDINITLEENEREELNRIIEALTMLENGAYGMCIDCNMPISEKRLELYPNAVRCISCQENRETT
jgi:DnaK suppressor protein